MKHHEAMLATADGLQLYCQGWSPDEAATALIILVHGLGEHSSRYSHVASVLVEAGYALLTFDLRGHGKSEGQRGHIPSFDYFMNDMDLIFEEAKRLYNGIPTFLYGHSLGSNLALSYVFDRKPELAGCIVTGPALRSAVQEQTLKVALAKVLGSLLPTVSMPTGLQTEFLSLDPEVVRAYVEDPLVHDRASFRFAKENFRMIDWLLSHAQDFPSTIPLLMMYGSSDKICYPSGGQEFAAKVSGECTEKVWIDLYHEIHNEPEKEQVFAYMLEWLERKTRSINE